MSVENNERIGKTIKALEEKGYEVTYIKKGSEALDKIKSIIPDHSSVMNGESVTLDQIGYKGYLESSNHKWEDLRAKITAEPDEEKRGKLSKESVLSDYYLGSVHALIENGEFVIASFTGSQLPHVVFTSPNLIFVVSTKKIASTLDGAIKRLNEHVIPQEDKRLQEVYKMNTTLNKIVIFKGESQMIGRKIHFILVDEDLGF
jgi:hypothetical protein